MFIGLLQSWSLVLVKPPCFCVNISLVFISSTWYSIVKTWHSSLESWLFRSFPIFRPLWNALECPSLSPQPPCDLTLGFKVSAPGYLFQPPGLGPRFPSFSLQFSSVAQSCPTLCDPMNRSTPGLPVHHQLPEFTQTIVHRVDDAVQPSHPLLSPSPPAPNPSQHQGLFQCVNSASGGQSIGVSALASVLPKNTPD